MGPLTPEAVAEAPSWRPELLPRGPVVWQEGRQRDVLMVRRGGGPPRVAGARVARLSAHGLSDWYTVRVGAVAPAVSALLADPRVESVYLAFAPQPPPEDLPPETPDFRAEQRWLDPFPGFGFDEAARWPGGTGTFVRIADVEYGWDPLHEDLSAAPESVSWGLDTQAYAFHGTSVLSMLVSGPDGYGVDGAVPDAEVVVVSPFTEDGTYSVAAAVAGAAALLAPGDVLLIEQQAYANGDYCPVSADPATFEAIAAAVAAGIVVVEPGGNGAQDLDHRSWDGWFDRNLQDSGSILVGGGASPDGTYEARAWYPLGSSYGSRVDVQGWYDAIVTATGADYGGSFADLWFPDRDGRQAYTRSFGGTSGASPMVAAAAAILQSARLASGLEPLPPLEVRAALSGTGTPQAGDVPIGPQPDLRRLLRTYALP